MKKILLFLISLLVGAGLFIWIGKIVGWEEIKKSLLVFTGRQGSVILGLTLLMILIGNWKWREILKGENIKISFGELLKPYLAGFAVKFLAPIMFLGGEVFRSYVLKKRNLVPWSKGVASIIIDRILEWTANLMVIFFGLLFFCLLVDTPPVKLGIIFGGVFLLFTAGITFFYFKSFRRESIIRLLIKENHEQPLKIEKEIFNFFKPKKKAMWKGFALAFLRAIAAYFRAWTLIIFLGKNIGALSALSILGFAYLATIIPIPTALGSHEALQTFSFTSLGLGASTATAFTMILRGADLIAALAGVIILFRLGIEFLRNTLLEKVNNFSSKLNNNDV